MGGDCNGTFAKTLTDALYRAFVNYGAQISGKYADSDEWRLVCRYSAGGFAGFTIFWLQSRTVPIERAKEILRDLIASPMHIGRKLLPDACWTMREKDFEQAPASALLPLNKLHDYR